MIFKAKVQSWTAQGRLTAWIVGLSPVGFTAVLYIMAPRFMMPLFVTSSGRWLLVLVCILIISGLLMVRRMVQIDT